VGYCTSRPTEMYQKSGSRMHFFWMWP
jgi:hypothetical protein